MGSTFTVKGKNSNRIFIARTFFSEGLGFLFMVTAKTPGTCGELVQGRVNGNNFLVTCPVDIYSHVTLSMTAEKTVSREKNWKAYEALKKVLKYFNQEALYNKIQVSIKPQIPCGKGMASSTADITGVCVAAARLLGLSISAKDIAGIALSIEPTDGIMFSGIALMDYLKGSIIENLGEAPEMNICIIDTGGTVDTIRFNQSDYSMAYAANETKIRESLELVKEGIKKRDSVLVARGATISALCHQDILFKPELDSIIALCKKIGGLGVNVAHSGTVIGILLHKDFNEFESLKQNVASRFNIKPEFHVTRLVGGGGVIVS